ncbi:MAG: hypothetical protein H0V09_08725 [Gemmatimonadetes bacterium]|nr:hypothetical protein [Gemmatimonadota bacterium]
MYQPDPVDAVRWLTRVLQPGGLVIFQERDSTVGPGRLTPLPLNERVRGWIWRTVSDEAPRPRPELAATMHEKEPP